MKFPPDIGTIGTAVPMAIAAVSKSSRLLTGGHQAAVAGFFTFIGLRPPSILPPAAAVLHDEPTPADGVYHVRPRILARSRRAMARYS